MTQTPDPDQEWRAPTGEVPADPAPLDRPAEQGGSVRYDDPTPGSRTDPYGGGHGAQAYDPHGQSDQPVTTHGSPPDAGAPSAPASTIVLLVISGLLTLTGVGILWAGPAVLAIVSLTKATTDPAGARRLTRIGWWIAAGLAVLGVLLVVLVVVLVAALGLAIPSTSGYDPSTVGLTPAVHALSALATAAAR